LPWPVVPYGSSTVVCQYDGPDAKMAGMDLARARFLVDVLAPSGSLERIREFAASLRQSTRREGELLVVGTPGFEPWHFTAHMADEARWARLPELEPTLVRWSVPPSAPSHLSVPLERLEAARRGETLMVVTIEQAPHPLLERVADARKVGATILTMDSGDPDLAGLAHDALVLPQGVKAENAGRDTEQDDIEETSAGLESPLVTFELGQHIVPVAAGDQGSAGRRQQSRLARFLDVIAGPAPRSPH
jgi:hypothetical protein